MALSPDSVTVYQMELPYNTKISGDVLKGGGQIADPVAGWPTKRPGWLTRSPRSSRRLTSAVPTRW